MLTILLFKLFSGLKSCCMCPTSFYYLPEYVNCKSKSFFSGFIEILATNLNVNLDCHERHGYKSLFHNSCHGLAV